MVLFILNFLAVVTLGVSLKDLLLLDQFDYNAIGDRYWKNTLKLTRKISYIDFNVG